MSDENQPVEVINEAPVEKPKRGRPKKQKIIISSEPVAEPVVTEPVAEPVTEPVAEPIAEPVVEPIEEPVIEVKTPRRSTSKRAPSRAPRGKKVRVNVEELGTHEELQTEPTNNYMYMSAADQLAMHLAQQRAAIRQEKSNKYKNLLAGAI